MAIPNIEITTPVQPPPSVFLLPGGVERTKAEYHTLLADAGLCLNRIIRTRIHLNILEAVKA
jgi:hypothetical protein